MIAAFLMVIGVYSDHIPQITTTLIGFISHVYITGRSKEIINKGGEVRIVIV